MIEDIDPPSGGARQFRQQSFGLIRGCTFKLNRLSDADTLYRAATETHRNHTRYSKLVERGAPDEEQLFALEMAYLCDDLLGDRYLGLREMPQKQRRNPTKRGGIRPTCCGMRARNTSAVMQLRWDVAPVGRRHLTAGRARDGVRSRGFGVLV